MPSRSKVRMGPVSMYVQLSPSAFEYTHVRW